MAMAAPLQALLTGAHQFGEFSKFYTLYRCFCHDYWLIFCRRLCWLFFGLLGELAPDFAVLLIKVVRQDSSARILRLVLWATPLAAL